LAPNAAFCNFFKPPCRRRVFIEFSELFHDFRPDQQFVGARPDRRAIARKQVGRWWREFVAAFVRFKIAL
jgi:hypothetical protein